MTRSLTPAFLALLAVFGSACTQLEPYRTRAVMTPSGAPDIVECESGAPREAARSCQNPDAGRYALQLRKYRYDREPGGPAPSKPQGADYYLSVVEFDDQGWFADRKQLQALMQLLAKIEAEDRTKNKNGHTLILVFAHGWKHTADRCDNNVLCFARVVERMDILEREAAALTTTSPGPRRVVGVYVAWRGLSLQPALVKEATFWTRKAAAERVGRGGVMELLTRLNEYRGVRNPCREDGKTQLAIVGHSFGGLVVHSALSHVIMERAADTGRYDTESCQAKRGPSLEAGGRTCYETARSFGDFVVLVNPAFEASLYEPLFNIAANRCYRDTQRPALMTVTSTGDWATGKVFPLGRFVSTLFERRQASSDAQTDAIVSAIGHDTRYETHKLRWRKGEGDVTITGRPQEPGQPVRVPEEKDCGCPYLDPPERFDWRGFVRVLEQKKSEAGAQVQPLDPPKPEKSAAGTERTCPAIPATPILAKPDPKGEGNLYTGYGPNVVLIGDKKYSPTYPYLVVKADKEIIADHNAIYSEPFVGFLHAFFLLHVATRHPFGPNECFAKTDACQPGGPMPCERACKLADGRDCTVTK